MYIIPILNSDIAFNKCCGFHLFALMSKVIFVLINYIKIILLFSFLLFSVTAYGLDSSKTLNQQVHNIWQIEDGLPQNSVQTIVQTKDGYLWMGTQEGLVRFDGVKFKIFNKINTPLFTRNYISTIYEDNNNNLWIGTEGGGLLLYKNGMFKSFNAGNKFLSDIIVIIKGDRKKNIWIGTTSGLISFNMGKIKTYTAKTGLLDDFITDIFEDSKGQIWIGTTSKGVSVLKDGNFKHITQRDGLSSNVISSICEDSNNRILIGTKDKGLNIIDGNEVESIKVVNEPIIQHISAILKDSNNNIWIGTFGNGIVLYKNSKFTSFQEKQGLSNNSIMSIFEDREKNLWVGTEGGGLNMFSDSKFTTYTEQEGLSNNSALALYQDSKNNIWIGTYGGGLNLYKNGKFTKFTKKDGMSSDMIMSITEDLDGKMWFGTNANGINVYKDNKFKHYTMEDGLSDNTVSAIYQDTKKRIWIGTKGGGLTVYNEGKFKIFNKKNGLSNTQITALHEDSKGKLWIGTEGGGIDIFEHGKFKNFNKDHGLSENQILSFYEDSENNLWIGTWGGGLNLYKNDKFYSFTTKQGIHDDAVYVILEDDNKNLWMCSNSGIFKVNKNQLFDYIKGKITKLSSTYYDTADGMKSRECYGGFQHAGLKTKEGKLIFPTLKGIVVVEPNKIKKNTIPPPVYIEALIVDKKELNLNKNIVLEPSAERLQFNFTGLSYSFPKKVLFKYRLKGFDKEWVESGKERTAHYTNIPPGRYSFQVKACNNDKVWNTKSASLTIIKKPYFYQTIWFYIFCTVFIFIVVIVIYKLRIRHLNKRHKELQLLNEALIEQDKLRNSFFRNTSHELRTPLNGIIGFTDLIKSGHFGKIPEQATGYMSKVMHLAESLKNQVNTILDLSKLRENKIELENNLINMKKVVEHCNVLADGLMTSNRNSDFKILSSFNNYENVVFISDYERLMIILRNLIGNAFKFYSVERKNSVLLSLDITEKSELNITISDTGIGIPKKFLSKIFDEFKQVEDDSRRQFEGTGLGLSMVKKIVDLMDGKIKVESEINKGTIFSLILPSFKTIDTIKTNNTIDNEYYINEFKSKNSNNIYNSLVDNKIIASEINKTNDESVSELNVFDSKNSNYTILIVDDIRLNVEVVEEILSSFGFKTESAYGGKEALEKIRIKKPSLILLDLMMPEISGEDVITEIKNDDNLKDIPVIILTARASEEDRVFGLSLGADDYIAKPIIKEELILRTNAVLKRIELTNEIAEAVNTLTKQEKMAQIGELMGDLSHELKNLHGSAISGFPITKDYLVGMLSSFSEIHPHWNELVTAFFQTESVQIEKIKNRKKIIVIPERISEDKQELLFEIKDVLAILNIEDSIIYDIWEILIQLEEGELASLTALLNSTRFLTLMYNSSSRAHQLMHSVLDHVKGESVSEPQRIEKIIQSCNLIIDKKLKKASVEFTINLDKNLSQYKVNPSLHQVILNLLLNAHDALNEDNSVINKKIELRLDKKEEVIRIQIEDNGKGIPDYIQSKIFERNFTTKGKKGTGVGLFISRYLIEKEGGYINLNSKAGQTIFEIGFKK